MVSVSRAVDAYPKILADWYEIWYLVIYISIFDKHKRYRKIKTFVENMHMHYCTFNFIEDHHWKICTEYQNRALCSTQINS